MVLHNGPIIRSPHSFPVPGTSAGIQARDLFISQMLSLGKCELFWLPKAGDTTTATDEALDARTITYSKDVSTFDTPPAQLGSAIFVDFDGVDEEADTPDVDDLSFVSGGVDQPFTVMVLVNPDDGTPTANASLFSKLDKDSDDEIREYTTLVTATNGYPRIVLWDESAAANIGREDQTALTDATWVLLTFTYDGSAVNNGIKIFKNDVQVDDADSSTGSYLAMENTATKPQIGFTLSADSAPVAEEFWAGGLAFVIVYRKELVAVEVEAAKSYVNTFLGLSL